MARARLRWRSVCTIVFTIAALFSAAPRAWPHECSVELSIHHGQRGSAIPENDEDTRGALTVLNRNDTNSNAKEDLGESPVAGEMDLMKLVLNATDSEFTLLNVGGVDKIKLWDTPTKQNEVKPNEDADTWRFTDSAQTLWVEGAAVSETVGDVSFEYVGLHEEPQPPPAPPPSPVRCGSDSATATIIWVEQTDVLHNAGDKAWTDFAGVPKKALNYRCNGGFGLRPVADYPRGVANCIAIQFKVQPQGVWDKGARFDVTRQSRQRWWVDGGSGLKLDKDLRWPNGDVPNDDKDEGEEADSSKIPTEKGFMYAVDGPGPKYPTTSNLEVVQRWNMREFVRVIFDDASFRGGLLSGSRCSFKYEWHATHRLTKKPQKAKTGTWARTTDNEEDEVNDIAPGLMSNIEATPK